MGPSGGAARAAEVLLVFLRLGLTSFGGPVAHLGYFRDEFVNRRRWLDDAAFADIVALCQFLPGPASSQAGIALGILRAGLPGAVLAWLGFTLPSAVLMLLFAQGVGWMGDSAEGAWLHGLKIVAVAVVANAVWTMARNLCPDRLRATMAVAAAVVALTVPSAAGQVAAIALGAVFGIVLLQDGGKVAASGTPPAIPLSVAVAALLVFAALLLLLPVAAAASGAAWVALADSFYRAGALIFGGGHVMLPLLKAEVVVPGWVGDDLFLAGYGAAQAVPGPLSTFAAYLGAVAVVGPSGWLGGLLCVTAIFLPSMLLVIGVLPFWDALRRRPLVQAGLKGVNAAVVGLLLAALYTPVWTSGILSAADFALAATAFLLLAAWQAPSWLVVVLGALAAEGVARLGAT